MEFDKVLQDGKCLIDGEFIKTSIAVKNGKIAKIGSHKKLIQSKNWYSETLKQNK